MNKNSKIFVAGHNGLLGNVVYHTLIDSGYSNILTKSHESLDLTNQNAVNRFFESEMPDCVMFFAAKRVNVLKKASNPIDACLDTIKMTVNVLDAAHNTKVEKLLLASSASAYPICTDNNTRKEDSILRGSYGKLDEPYSLGKIVGAKLCEYYYRQYGNNFFSVMPCVFFGPRDNFEIGSGPVVPTLIHRIHDAKIGGEEKFVLWGSGMPKREIIYVKDVANACVFLLENGEGGENYNIGNGGMMISVLDLAKTIASVVGYSGEIVTDTSKPDGAMSYPLDSNHLMGMGWKPLYSLNEALEETYEYFLEHIENNDSSYSSKL